MEGYTRIEFERMFYSNSCERGYELEYHHPKLKKGYTDFNGDQKMFDTKKKLIKFFELENIKLIKSEDVMSPFGNMATRYIMTTYEAFMPNKFFELID